MTDCLEVVARLEADLAEARKLVREYYDAIRHNQKGYAATLEERYPWILEIPSLTGGKD